MNVLNTLWTEKYRPRTVDGYVFKDQRQREQIDSWIATKNIPHLLLSGSAGTGKTTLAKILIEAIEINPYDVKEINASRENKIENFRDDIYNFCMTMPVGDMRVILLDEADYITPASQAILRNLMETFADHVRFILTCNYPNKIIPAIHSRCQGFHIDKTDMTEFTARCATVLIEEGVEFDLDVLDSYVRVSYPDLRKTLNRLQQNSTSSKLNPLVADSGGTDDYKLKMLQLFKTGRIREARKLICDQIQPEEYSEVYRWLYDNLDLWSSEEQQDAALMIIRTGLVNHALVADPEINLSACLIELSRL